MDVNVLIALFDETHVHHEVAHDWFYDEADNGWATCPVTENGFVRVMTHPRVSDASVRGIVLPSLKRLCSTRYHEFWEDSVSFGDETFFDRNVVVPSRHVTDVYLLGLTVRKKGRLVTFDGRIPRSAVVDASPESLVVLAP